MTASNAWNSKSDVLSVSVAPTCAAGPAGASKTAQATMVQEALHSVMAQFQALPAAFALRGNTPNPFTTSTEIRFDLPEAAHVKLAVYNMLGQEVRRLVDSDMGAGFQRVTFSTEDLPSGVYLYRLTAGTFTDTKRMVIVR